MIKRTITYLIAAMLTLTACQTAPLVDEVIPLDIKELETSVHMHDVLGDDGAIYYSVPIVQIHGMIDRAVEENINNTLETTITNLADTENYWLSLASLSMSHIGNRYLQVTYLVRWTDPHSNVVRIHIIMDLQTGERLFLDDIVELTDDFSEAMLAQNDDELEIYITFYEEDIAEILREACMSEMEYKESLAKEDAYYEGKTKMASRLSGKAGARIESDQLVITRQATWGHQDLYFPYEELTNLKIQLDSDNACWVALDLTTENRQKICQEH